MFAPELLRVEAALPLLPLCRSQPEEDDASQWVERGEGWGVDGMKESEGLKGDPDGPQRETAVCQSWASWFCVPAAPPPTPS